MLFLTSEELESLLIAFYITVAMGIRLCAYVLYMFMCVCTYTHICI